MADQWELDTLKELNNIPATDRHTKPFLIWNDILQTDYIRVLQILGLPLEIFGMRLMAMMNH